MNIRRMTFSCLMVLLLAASAWAAGNVWVASEGTELKKAPDGTSAVVGTLKLDERLDVLGKSGRWYNVKTPTGKTGWVYRGKISASQPQRDTTKGAPGLFGSLDSDIAANEASTDRAMRGLSPETEVYANETGTPEEYRKALDSVLERATTPEQVTEFLKRGKIGEYAR